MSQFWQKRQPRLQPAVPKERTGEPGRKWFSGFFSIGSTQKPLDRPYVVRTIPAARGPHEADAPLALLQPAVARADVALDAAAVEACQWVVGWKAPGALTEPRLDPNMGRSGGGGKPRRGYSKYPLTSRMK